MAADHLIELWEREASQPFSGWDFSYLRGRYQEEAPPWSYDAMAISALRGVSAVLDMGTGGGEKLLELADSLPAQTTATEGHPPNVAVARANLEPQGIAVVEYDSESGQRMPFGDAVFPLLLNRHESFDAAEIGRVLSPGGRFLTQQVGADNLAELRDLFGMRPRFLDVTLANHRRHLTDAGLHVEFAQEWRGSAEFSDVGALVYFLKAVPWEAPADFSVRRYREVLLSLHDRPEPLRLTIHRFALQVRRGPTEL
ncbi:MAG: methyltransferase domain-containing protein [Actinomycetota bacterium]